MTHEEKVIHPADRELMFSVALAEQISNFFPAFQGEIGVENKMALLKWVMDEYRKAVASAEKKGREEVIEAVDGLIEDARMAQIDGNESWNKALQQMAYKCEALVRRFKAESINKLKRG